MKNITFKEIVLTYIQDYTMKDNNKIEKKFLTKNATNNYNNSNNMINVNRDNDPTQNSNNFCPPIRPMNNHNPMHNQMQYDRQMDMPMQYHMPMQQPIPIPYIYPIYQPQMQNSTECQNCKHSCKNYDMIIEMSNQIEKLASSVNFLKKEISKISRKLKSNDRNGGNNPPGLPQSFGKKPFSLFGDLAPLKPPLRPPLGQNRLPLRKNRFPNKPRNSNNSKNPNGPNDGPNDDPNDGLLIITLKSEMGKKGRSQKPNNNNKHNKENKDESIDEMIMSSILGNIFGSLLGKEKLSNGNDDEETSDKKEDQQFELDLNAEYDELKEKVKTLDDLIKLAKQYKPQKKEKKKRKILTNGYDTIEYKKRIDISDDKSNNRENDLSKEKEENNSDNNKDDELEKRYSFDLKMLHNILEPMETLNNMIGWKDIKKSITEFIIYHSQRLEKQQEDMFHTVIQGPPGVGKTELGKILGKIYKGMGIIKSDKFKIVKRSDLIGQYLGHTAAKTQEAIDDCEGGVMFIDEAYSLGNAEGKDIYSKECIDTLNANLSENKKKFICIIAGYKDSLEKCFFSYNEGLRRRFSFKYTIEGYKPDELCKIFAKKAKDISFEFDDEMLESNEMEDFFKENKDSFPDFGGDMETLLLNCKITHSNRIFGKHPKYRKKINKEDIKNGLERFLLHRQIKKDDQYKYFMYI